MDLEAMKERAEEMSGRAREAQRAADENMDKARAFDELEARLRTARLELDAARALSKSQAEALADVAESEKAAARTAQVWAFVRVCVYALAGVFCGCVFVFLHGWDNFGGAPLSPFFSAIKC